MNSTGKWLGSRETATTDYMSCKAVNAEKIARQLLYKDNSLQTMPLWVAFSATTFCNLKCPHCATHGTEEVSAEYNKRHWPYELTLKLSAETLPHAYQFCLTLNGEPLATPYFQKLIATLRPYEARLHITTNGILMSKEVLIQLLPLASRIDISIDGGTKGVVEAIRLGTKFEQLVNRIRVLTRSSELLRDLIAPPIHFAYTVMGSNIRDMPEVIRLAHALGVRCVDFYPIHIHYPHVADEAIDLYAPLYNAYFQKTVEEARLLNIDVNLFLPMFPGIDPDPDFAVVGKQMIINPPPAYYDSLPEPESFLNYENIESEALEIETAIRGGFQRIPPLSKVQRVNKRIRQLKIFLREFARNSDDTIQWCEELATKAYIRSSGDVAPCCMPGQPTFGNVHSETVTEIWNGSKRAAFCQRFHSSSQPDCCKNCRNNVRISRRELINILMPL